MPISTRDIRTSTPVVIMSGLPKRGRKLLKTRAVLLLLTLLIVVGIILSIANWHHRKLVAERVINQSKVSALIKSNDCSDKAQQSVSAEQPDPSRVQASITLLSYRASCLIQTAQYTKANQVLEQLKTYYVKENNTTAVISTDQQIDANSYAATHPVKRNVKMPPEISPQESRKINAFFGNSQ